MSTPHDRQIVAEFWIESRRTKKLERALQTTKERAPEVLRLLRDPTIAKARAGFHLIDDLRALCDGRRCLPCCLQLRRAGADLVVIGLRGQRAPFTPSRRIAVGRRRSPGRVARLGRLQCHGGGADLVLIDLRCRGALDVPSGRIAVWRRWCPGLVCKYGRCGDPECPRDEGHRACLPECSLYNRHHYLLLRGYGETSWCLGYQV